MCKIGNNLVLTCRTRLKDRNGHFFEVPCANVIDPFIKDKIDMYDNFSNEMNAHLDGKYFH